VTDEIACGFVNGIITYRFEGTFSGDGETGVGLDFAGPNATQYSIGNLWCNPANLSYCSFVGLTAGDNPIDGPGSAYWDWSETGYELTPAESKSLDWSIFNLYVVSGCGNGFLDPGEACDDGDTTSGDGCSDICLAESNYTCEGEPSFCSLSVPTLAPAGRVLLLLAIAIGGLRSAPK
jgi:cysteine-rich repeat protein